MCVCVCVCVSVCLDGWVLKIKYVQVALILSCLALIGYLLSLQYQYYVMYISLVKMFEWVENQVNAESSRYFIPI